MRFLMISWQDVICFSWNLHDNFFCIFVLIVVKESTKNIQTPLPYIQNKPLCFFSKDHKWKNTFWQDVIRFSWNLHDNFLCIFVLIVVKEPTKNIQTPLRCIQNKKN